MKQNNKSDSTVWLMLLGIVLLILVVVCFFNHNEKIKQYKEDLEDRIRDKERSVEYLKKELDKLRNMKTRLVADAVGVYKMLKRLTAFILCVIGVSAFLLTQANIYEAIGVIFTCITVVYHTISVVIKNRVGNFNDTLTVLQNYFIEREYRKNGFEPMLIEVYQSRLESEQRELNALREQHRMKYLN